MTKDSGIVMIHGKEYQTVASRVKKFRDESKDTFSIETELIRADGDVVIMKATIRNIVHEQQPIVATGHAEERRDASQINKTSALEVCETSAIGRALAAFGLAGTEFASADEVANAISNQKNPTGMKATANQIETMFSLAKQQGFTEKADAHKWLTDEGKKDPLTMSTKEASKLIAKLMEK